MLSLQRKINGENITLSPEDIKTILRQPVDEAFMRVYYRALKSKNIDATEILLGVLPRIERGSELLLVALPLRFGANPNFYVDVPTRGTMHIIPYVYSLPWETSSRTPDLRDDIVRLLLLSNSLASKPCFDPNGGSSSSSSLRSEEKEDIKQHVESVYEYCRRLYNVDLSVPITPRKEHAILLDNIDLLPAVPGADIRDVRLKKLEENDRLQVVRCFSEFMWPLLPNLPKDNIEDPPGMKECVDCYNAEIFDIIVKLGYLPTYVLLSKIITQMRNSKHPLVQSDLTEMLYRSVEYGAQVDKAQYGYIESMTAVKPEFDRRYNVPYYTKVCKTDRTLPPTTALKSEYYGIEGTTHNSKDVMCRTLEELSKASPEKAREILVETNREKLSKPSALALLRGDTKTLQPEEYIRLPDQIVTYRDANGNLNMYTADRYDDILERGRDNYTDLPVARDILDEMRLKKSNLTKMGRELFIDPVDIYKMNIPRGLRDVFANDKPRESNVPMQYFRRTLVDNNISIDYWESLEEGMLLNILQRVGVTSSLTGSVTLQRQNVAMAYFSLPSEKQKLLLLILQRRDGVQS